MTEKLNIRKVLGIIFGAIILLNIIPCICMTLSSVPIIERATGVWMLYALGHFLNAVIGVVGFLFFISFKLLRIN